MALIATGFGIPPRVLGEGRSQNSLTWSAMPAAATAWGTSNGSSGGLHDLTGMAYARVSCYVLTTGPTGASLYYQASFAEYPQTFANFGPTIGIGSTGPKSTGWFAIPPKMRRDNVILSVWGSGGNGSTSPIIRGFRVEIVSKIPVTNTTAIPTADVTPATNDDWLGWNYNRKYDKSTAYLNFLNSTVPQGFGLYAREAPWGAPTASAGTPFPSWTGYDTGALAWYISMFNENWLAGNGKFISTEIDITKAGPGSGAGFFADGAKDTNCYEASVKYRVAKLKTLASKTKIWHNPANENDMSGSTSTGGWFVSDSPANVRATAKDRISRGMVYVHDELRCVPGKVMYNTSPIPADSPIIGPCTAFMNWDPIGIQNCSLEDILLHNGAAAYGAVDAVSAHYHNAHTSREDPNGANNVYYHDNCPIHAWRSIKLAYAANPAAGMKPLCITEMGHDFDNLVGTWSGNPRYTLKSLREFQSMLACMWFGVTMVEGYCWSYSPDTGMNLYDKNASFAAYTDPGAGTIPTPAANWATIWDWRRYAYRATIPVPNKTWQTYCDPATGAVWINDNVAPTSTPYANPFPEWGRVTMDGNYITMTAGARNTVCFPMWLPDLSTRNWSADIAVTGGGSARVFARGFDKLDGTVDPGQSQAGSKTTSATEATKTVTFTPRAHNVAGLSNPKYVLLGIDHNGVGTCTIRNMRFT